MLQRGLRLPDAFADVLLHGHSCLAVGNGATEGSPTRRSRCRADVDSGGEHGRVAP